MDLNIPEMDGFGFLEMQSDFEKHLPRGLLINHSLKRRYRISYGSNFRGKNSRQFLKRSHFIKGFIVIAQIQPGKLPIFPFADLLFSHAIIS